MLQKPFLTIWLTRKYFCGVNFDLKYIIEIFIN